MKKDKIREMADQVYSILDESASDIAVERAMQVLKTAPQDAQSYLLLAEVAEENDRLDHAMIWVNKGLEHHEDHAGLLLKKATILIDGFEEIEEAFEILVSIKNKFGDKSFLELKREYDEELLLDVYLLLTDSYRLKDNYSQAFESASIAKDISPQDEAAILSLATAHFELGDYRKALWIVEPIESRNEKSDFYWLKAQIKCAEGNTTDADDAFASANRLARSRYHRPVRVSNEIFAGAFDQAVLAMPKEIRDFVSNASVTIIEVIPLDLIKGSRGTLSPLACVAIDSAKRLNLFQRNIENIAFNKNELKDVIASALLHELGQVCLN